MKFIATTSDKISSINVVSGQLIFSRDDRVIYLDTDKRTSFQQILIISDESTRNNLNFPVEGFYFVEETAVLWRYKNATWTQLTVTPDEKVVFLNKESFPATGKTNILYIDKDKFYQWDSESQEYYEMGGTALQWESIA